MVKHASPRLFIPTLALLLLAVLIYSNFSPGQELKPPPQLPGGLALKESMMGEGVASYLENLLPGSANILGEGVEGAVIGFYDKGVWLALVPLDNCGRVGGLARLMAEGKGILTEALARRTGEGGVYYIAIGKLDSSVHVFWCWSKALVWLRVPPTVSQVVVEGLLSQYPPST